MRRLRKPLVIFFATVIMISGSIPLILHLSQDRIKNVVISKINESQPGLATCESIDVTLLSDLPDIGLSLSGFKYFEEKDRENARDSLPLLKLGELKLKINPFKAMTGVISVTEFSLNDGFLGLRKHPDGSLNLSNAIKMESEEETQPEDSLKENSAQDWSLDIENVRFRNLVFDFEDRKEAQRIAVRINKLNTALLASEENLDFNLGLNAELLGIKTKNKVFLKNKGALLETKLAYDKKHKTLTLAPSELNLAGALFDIRGDIDFGNEGMLDLEINGRPSQSRAFLALTDYAEADTKKMPEKGDAYLRFSAKGKTIGQAPHVELDCGFSDLDIAHPDWKAAIRDINLDLHFDNGTENNLNTSTLEIRRFQAKPNLGYINISGRIENFEKPYIKAKAEADLILDGLDKLLKIEEIEKLQGKVSAKVDLDQAFDFDNLVAEETFSKIKTNAIVLDKISFRSKSLNNTVEDINGIFYLQDDHLGIHRLKAKIQHNDIEFSGYIKNYPALFLPAGKEVSGKLKIYSDRLSMPELLAFDSLLAQSVDEEIRNFQFEASVKANAEHIRAKRIPEFSFTIDKLSLDAKSIAPLHNLQGVMGLKDGNIGIQKLRGNIGQSDFELSAGILNAKALAKYQRDSSQTVTFAFNINSEKMRMQDLATFKGKSLLPEPYDKETISDFNITGGYELSNQDLIVRLDSTKTAERKIPESRLFVRKLQGKTTSFPLALSDFNIDIVFQDQAILIKDFTGKAGHSDFAFNAKLDRLKSIAQDSSLYQVEGSFDFKSKTLDLDELLAFQLPESPKSQDAEELAELQKQNMEKGALATLLRNGLPRLNFNAEIGKINFAAQSVKDFRGEIQTENTSVTLKNLSFEAAQGKVALNGTLDGKNPKALTLVSTASVKGMDLNHLDLKMSTEDMEIDIRKNFEGIIDAELTSSLQLKPDMSVDLNKSEAKIKATIRNGKIKEFAPMLALSDYMGNKDLNAVRFAELTNTFELKDAKLTIPRMNISTTIGQMYFSGTQGLDTSMEYNIEIPFKLVRQVAWSTLVRKKRKEGAKEDEIQKASKGAYISVNVSGDLENYKVGLGKKKKRKSK
ncbi:hypothetical protein FUAX_11220 [Fulvitalea axinellae]|uniref:AsmA-like C-terminal domain-containing protein n=1 Tax=Fulvitalea axinellae TaxID=1182444 RepID=A0AAU9CHG3_9BACT|nr:hypothetical protein FUAX_11220 [Fulvitalea axinellae]